MGEMDRRTLLRRGSIAAAATGAAWVTPAITSTPALAGASCLQQASFAWTSLGGDDTIVPVSPTPFASYGALGPGYPALTISQSFTAFGTPAAGLAPQTGRTKTGDFGGANSCYRQSMTCDAANEGWDSTFTFSVPVWNLRFSLYDIDIGSGTYIDEAYITSTSAFTFTLPAGGTVTGNGTSTDRWIGSTVVGNTSTAGNVNITFAGPVTSFTLSFRSGNNSNTTQAIGLGDLQFCR